MNIIHIPMPPVARLTWNSGPARDYWAPRMARAKALCRRLEMESVRHGLRDAGILSMSPETIDAWTESGGKFVEIAKADPQDTHALSLKENGRPFGVICRDVAKGEAIKKAYWAREDAEVGHLQGYPGCCVDFFNRAWTAGFIDPIWQQAAGFDHPVKQTRIHVKGHPYCNVVLRVFGLRLAPMLPHSFDCPECIAQVHPLVTLAMDLDPAAATDLLTLLEMPLRWDCLKGIAIIHTPIFRCHVNSVACYPRYVLDYEASHPRYFDWNTFPHPSKGYGWPYDQFTPAAILDRFSHVETEDDSKRNAHMSEHQPG